MLIYVRDKQIKDIIIMYLLWIKVVLDKFKSNVGDFDIQVYMCEIGWFLIKFDVNNFIDIILKGFYVRLIIELQSLWFSVMGFGCKWCLF